MVPCKLCLLPVQHATTYLERCCQSRHMIYYKTLRQIAKRLEGGPHVFQPIMEGHWQHPHPNRKAIR